MVSRKTENILLTNMCKLVLYSLFFLWTVSKVVEKLFFYFILNDKVTNAILSSWRPIFSHVLFSLSFSFLFLLYSLDISLFYFSFRSMEKLSYTPLFSSFVSWLMTLKHSSSLSLCRFSSSFSQLLFVSSDSNQALNRYCGLSHDFIFLCLSTKGKRKKIKRRRRSIINYYHVTHSIYIFHPFLHSNYVK